jgi:hypothetical protein
MKKVYTAKDPLMVGHLKNVLETYGIHCVTRKYDLSSGAGELPPTECWPELWIVNEQRFNEAESILKKTLAPLKPVRKPWRCGGCGESIEGQFTECWKCGTSRVPERPGRPHLRIVSRSARHK